MRVFQLLWGLFLDLCVLPLAGLMRLFSLLEPRGLGHFYPVDDARQAPILLVHGSGSSTFQWWFPRVTALKHRNIHFIQLDNRPEVGLERHADQVSDQIEHLFRIYKKKVTVIGASMGGIVGAMAAARSPQKIAQVFTLSSPFGGAQALRYLSDLPCLKARRYRDMHPDSKLLDTIGHKIADSEIQLHCFRSFCDLQVMAEDAYPVGSGATVSDVVAGHLSIMINSTVWSAIVEQIDNWEDPDPRGEESKI